MANHVENFIHIINANEDVLNEVKRIFEKEEGQYDVQTEALAQRVYGDETPLEYDREWYTNNCGAKWMYGHIEDDDMEDIGIEITSAWDNINVWVDRFAQNLRKIKSDVIVHNTYEDEGYNFAGVYYTSAEYDDDEGVDMGEYEDSYLWEDDDARDRYFDELGSILDMHRQCHIDRIVDMNENPDNYSDVTDKDLMS
jgi:hypothetical protein